MGFLSAFGYWISSVLGNVFYWVLTATLGVFFRYIVGVGTTIIAILVSLVGVWAFHFLILGGAFLAWTLICAEVVVAAGR